MKKHLKKIIIASVVLVMIITGIIINQKEEVIDIPAIIGDVEEKKKVIVEIKGEVNIPGIYILEEDARIYDVVYLAGGLTVNANSESLNLASKLTDGMVIFVSKKNDKNNHSKVSINTASLNELMTLNGIGETRARNIINYRNDNGPFSKIEEIKNVTGISDAIYEQIKEHICI